MGKPNEFSKNPPKVEKSAAPEPPPWTGPRRLVCTRPNASNNINGVMFASVSIGPDNAAVHVSEHVSDEAKFNHFCRIPGYGPWDGDEMKDGPAIEDGLKKSEAAVAALNPVGTLDGQVTARSLAEQRASNERLIEKLGLAADRVRELETENAALKKQVAQLESEKLQAAAEKPAPVAAAA